MALTSLGCSNNDSQSSDPVPSRIPTSPNELEPVKGDVPEEPTPGQQTMHDRYAAIETARVALERGDVEGAKGMLFALGPVSRESLPEAARHLHDAIPQAARRVKAASGLEAVSIAFSAMVSQCGACHRAAGALVHFEEVAPPEGESTAAHMQKHQWAAERMWEGLLSGSSERFDRGASALTEAPLTGADAPDEEFPAEVSGLAARVHSLARELPENQKLAPRAEIFGKVLASCGGCHQHIPTPELLGGGE